MSLSGCFPTPCRFWKKSELQNRKWAQNVNKYLPISKSLLRSSEKQRHYRGAFHITVLIYGDTFKWGLARWNIKSIITHDKENHGWVWLEIWNSSQIKDGSELNYPSLNYIRFADAHHALLDPQIPEQSDSVTALTEALLYDEWGEAPPFEVIKQRKVGRCVAMCQSFGRRQRGVGGGEWHMMANGWRLWSCSQTKGQIKRVINTSGHKSKFAPVRVYKLPTIKVEHLALLHHSATQEGRSLHWEILVLLAGAPQQDGAHFLAFRPR